MVIIQNKLKTISTLSTIMNRIGKFNREKLEN